MPLSQQDTCRWDGRILQQARQALRRAERNLSLGRYQLEAAIQAVHCHRRESGITDWPALLHLHEGLARILSTVGALTGHVAALAEVEGVAAKLKALEVFPPELVRSYQPW